MSQTPTQTAHLPISPAVSRTASPPLPRRRWLQFSLRTLLGAILLVGLFLGWWFRPFVVETRRDDGSLRTRFELRRDWRGRYVSHGTQAWYMRNGTRFTRSDYGTPLADNEFLSMLARDGDFDSLIWWITETIEPDSWGGGRLSLQIGGGQTVDASDAQSMTLDTPHEPKPTYNAVE